MGYFNGNKAANGIAFLNGERPVLVVDLEHVSQPVKASLAASKGVVQIVGASGRWVECERQVQFVRLDGFRALLIRLSSRSPRPWLRHPATGPDGR